MTSQTPKTINFHFVIGNPQSESEKRNVRTIVRSNASNRRWRLAREIAAKSKPRGDGEDENQSQSDASSVNAISNGSASVDASMIAYRHARLQHLAGKNARRQSKALAHGGTSLLGSPTKVVNLAQNFFGPIAESEVSRRSITRMLQGTMNSYARLIPSGKGSAVGQMARDWFHQCLQSRGTLHTALFCQAVRAQAAYPGWSAMPDNELVLCQTEALHAINQKLSQVDTAYDDESLRIVFSLTWHGSVKQVLPARCPRQSPLADLQSLRMFTGVIACDPIHAQGLDKMLKLKGGLHKVSMPGLAFLISFGDTLMASCNLTRPVWSYGSYAQCNIDAVVDEDWLQSIQSSDHPLATLGDGFSALHLWLPYERAYELQMVSNRLADYIRASDDYIHAPLIERNHALMADQRNEIQHQLMSLCLLDDELFDERDLFELCWLATVAYSLIAVFPLAPNAARFDRLSQRIQDALSKPLALQRWSQAPDLTLWITVVGALCAVGTAERSWYVRLLKKITANMGICSWPEVRARVMRFLWFPSVGDADGKALWLEVDPLEHVPP